MRWCTYASSDGTDRLGLVEGTRVLGLEAGVRLVDLLGDDGDRLRTTAASARTRPAEELEMDGLMLRAPIAVPPSVRDFLSFEGHIRNTRGDPVDPGWYEQPVFYFSNPAGVIGPHDDVAIAPGSSEWDYELEVAAVVGRPGSDLTADEAESHIAGYMVMCDFSARDLQRREMAQGLGPAKGKDSATSFGPVMVTPDELEPRRSRRAFDLAMDVSVNGRHAGGGSLDDLYWSFGDMVAYASRGTTVRPGDIIGSGTVGTGCILEHRRLGRDVGWLSPGDVVELEVELIGTLRHRVRAGRPAVALRPPRTS
ncbi:MAG TPA: fumarylacetoacetate hydrolase family protein [Acidimicrobiales bacterium]|nr:fumarylacetoacetate hydrolase family protein [Acidimicrobiales bacterium]